MGSFLLKEVENFVPCFRFALYFLWDVVTIRFFFRAIIDKVTFSNVFGQQLFEAAEVFFAQVVPEISVFRRNEIIIDKRLSSKCYGALSVILLVELL